MATSIGRNIAPSGASGISGASGTSGSSGISGTSGLSGLQGGSGVSGFSGTSGFSGIFSGYSGFSGASGASGGSAESIDISEVARKGDAESLTNDDTLNDDYTLSFDVGAFEVWRFSFYVKFTCTGTGPDIKAGLNGPSSMSVLANIEYPNRLATATNDWELVEAFNTALGENFTATPIDTMFKMDGVADNRDIIGPLILMWSQRSSNANDTTVESGHVVAHKIFELGSLQIADASRDITVFLNGNGQAYATGLGSGGALGNNRTDNTSRPVSVVGRHIFSSVSAGANYALALKGDGTVWSWGTNTAGPLGDNSTTSKSSPVSVVGGHSFSQIAAFNHSLALKADGTAWAWGGNSQGNLGDNTTSNRSSPVSVVGDHSFVYISAGGFSSGSHSLALKADGTAWAWGDAGLGEMGDNSTSDKSSPVSVLGDHSFVAIAAGRNGQSFGLKEDGSVWAWGQQPVGDGTASNRSSPVSVLGEHSFASITGGPHGLKGDGSLWGWGSGSQGRIGDNSTTNRTSPVSVLGGHSFIFASGGSSHSMAIKDGGVAWGWGDNTTGGRLGDRTTTDRSSPVVIG